MLVNIISDSVGVLKPQYGRKLCRVAGDSYSYYIEIPTGVLMAANLTLLGSGVYYIWMAKQASAGAGKADGGAIQKNL